MGNRATGPARDLPEQWRSLAAQQRDLGAEAQARTLEWCAAALEGAIASEDTRLLTIAQASTLGGYSEEHLRRLVRAGKLPAEQAGQGKRIRLRWRDVPRKATLRLHESEIAPAISLPYDPGRDARDIAQAIGGI